MKFLLGFIFLLIIDSAFALECSEGKYLVNEHLRTAYYRDDGTYVSEADVSSYCKNYRSDGPLKIKFQRRIPKGWPFKKEIFKKCASREQKNIANVLDSLPKILTQVGKIKILCAKKSETEDNSATSSPEGKIIVLYDSAFKMDIRRILTHELAHFLYDALSDEERKQYWNIAQWDDKNLERIPKTTRKIFSAPDGKYNPDEDFANNIENFYVETEIMRKNFPSISAWIFKFLGGRL